MYRLKHYPNFVNMFFVTMMVVSVFFIVVGDSYSQSDKQVISKIKIEGLRSLTKEFVFSKIRSREGNYFYASAVKQDIKALYATGHFAMINFETKNTPKGVELSIKIEEKPVLTKVSFFGNNKIKEKVLRKKIKSSVGSPADEGKIKSDILELKGFYISKGYPKTEIDYKLDIDSKKNEASLRFIIDEGRRQKVKKIIFKGAKSFKPRRLAKLMKTKKESIWPLNVLLKTGVLDEEVFAEDLDRLISFYNYKGFLDAKLVDVKRVPVKKNNINIEIVIEEGPTYNVGDLSIDGNAVFPTTSIKSFMVSMPGSLYSPEKLNKDIKAIEDFYYGHGYIEVRVDRKVTFNSATQKMDLAFSISEGGIFSINKVYVHGNYKTKDKVIRRELTVFPGEVFDGRKLKTSQKRLENMGYFEKVKFSVEDSDKKDSKDLVFDLEEKKTGAFSFGAGFSSIDSFVGFAEVSQSNFDLFNFKNFQGGGQKFRIRFEGGNKRQNFSINFVEPYFLGRKLLFGFEGFVDRSDYLSGDYDEDRVGVTFRLGKALGEYLRGDTFLTIENIDVDTDPEASQEILDEDGSYDMVSVSFKLTHDTRDRIVFPTRGSKTTGICKIAGGSENYTRVDFKRSFYVAPFSNFPKHIVHMVNGAGVVSGFGGKRVPIFDRMFLGGANTIRGFEFRAVGPQDINDEPLGGKLKLWGSVEYLFPIIDRVYGASFVDYGNVYKKMGDFGSDINVGIGLGVRLQLPIGPIKLDYGFPIITDDYTEDANPEFHFSMGSSF